MMGMRWFVAVVRTYDSEQSVKKDSLERIRIQDKLYAGVYIGSWSWIGHADRRGGSVMYEISIRDEI